MFRCRSSDGENFDIVPKDLDFSIDGDGFAYLSGYLVKLNFSVITHCNDRRETTEKVTYCICATWADLGNTIQEQAKRTAEMARGRDETIAVNLVSVEFVDDGIYISDEYATFMRTTQ